MTDTNTNNDNATEVATLLESYIAVWNDTDPVRRRAEVERLWAAGAVYANGESIYRGHEQIASGITKSHDAWVGTGHSFSAARSPDHHHGRVRFVWNMYGPDGTVVSVGTNFIGVDDDGRIASDFQFVDR